MNKHSLKANVSRDESHDAEGARSQARIGPSLRSGKARTAILLWLLGVPIPLILLILLIRSCM